MGGYERDRMCRPASRCNDRALLNSNSSIDAPHTGGHLRGWGVRVIAEEFAKYIKTEDQNRE